ncbi:hypothetical protein JIG36_50865 [Actinoplanes sp. LDG1-06]|uniref:Lipoprotein n=1 Tax=Paractinoplanes ovalisporus TaxID=2810368 RepID=A0ABS2AVG9_9ACTN|nr:hypothetical protein [Actinoplanes ovalisporus]MBM2623821.1 hypothetical protein [Actinoplanes ovalisporus]
MRKVSVKVISGMALLLALAACGGTSDEGEPQVAAIPGAVTPSGASSAGTAGSDGENVRQLPLGATKEEVQRAYDAYYACWTQHGVPSAPDDGGPLASWKGDPKKYQPAVDACADKQPLDAPELDPRQNPNYVDDLREEKDCMESRGYKMEIRGSGSEAELWGISSKANLEKLNSDQGSQDYRECEIAAFTQK